MVVQRFDVWLVTLDPTVGSEIRKRRWSSPRTR
jgi:mRNA-degrading endonuclease toxin of MazEF toxin-antitoxin module